MMTFGEAAAMPGLTVDEWLHYASLAMPIGMGSSMDVLSCTAAAAVEARKLADAYAAQVRDLQCKVEDLQKQVTTLGDERPRAELYRFPDRGME